jgi:nucleotide-binding universal stress UspA family protein
MTKLLIPLDGTNFAEEALVEDAFPALRDDVELLLLHCVDLNRLLAFPPQPVTMHAELIEQHERRCQAYIDRLTTRLKEGTYASVRGLVETGHPVEAILRAAERENVDMIVMTTHGRSGLARLILGSVADGVVRRSVKPVLLLPARERPGAGESVIGDLVL